MSTGTDHCRAAERLLAGATSHQPATGHFDRHELLAAEVVRWMSHRSSHPGSRSALLRAVQIRHRNEWVRSNIAGRRSGASQESVDDASYWGYSGCIEVELG